jgi:predicted permease
MSGGGARRPRLFRLPFSRRTLRDDVDAELRFHLEGRVEELIAAGMERPDAEREARARFGDLESHRRQLRAIDEEIQRMRERREIIDSLRREIRHALRALARTPAFTAMTLLTRAIGLGAATAIYAVLDAVVLRPLPYPHGDRLVSLTTPVPGITASPVWGLARHEMYHFARESRTLEAIAVFRGGESTVMGDGGAHQAERARTAEVSASIFGVLGIAPERGRLFTVDDNRVRGYGVAVLGHAYWQRRFGGDPAVVGRTIDLDGFPVTIAGVLPARAQLPDRAVDVWLPLYMPPEMPAISNHVFRSIARLRAGVNVGAAQRELAALTARFPEVFPDVYSARMMATTGFTTAVTPLRDAVVGELVARALWIVFGAVGVVLLIAAANVANLFLVRLDTRRREVALRTALGADRGHLAWYFLSESLLLTLGAAAAAAAVAWAGLRLLVALAPATLPRLDEIGLSWRGIGFCVGCALLAGVVFGSLPLVRNSADLALLREGGRGATRSRGRLAARNVLVVGQVGLALMLLAAAGLLVQSLRNLHAVRPGFDPHDVVTTSLSLPYARYDSYERVSGFYQQLAARLAALPGVQAVGFGQELPPSVSDGCTTIVVEVPGRPGDRSDCLQMMHVSPGYFAALRIPVRGHAPDWTETAQRTGAMVVSAALAARFWPGEEAIGRGAKCCNATPPFYRITGVTGDVRTHGLDRPPGQVAYFPLLPHAGTQGQAPPNNMEMVVRSAGADIGSLVPAIRRAVAALDPQVAVGRMEPMEAVLARSLARRSFTMVLLGIAAAMAVLLSAVGIYGVISYVVAQRRGEIGIRLALGADAGRVRALVVSQSLALALAGVLLGLGGAVLTTRLLGALLFGVSPTDPVVLAVATAAVIALGAAASYAPARRASRVDPAEALRAD